MSDEIPNTREIGMFLHCGLCLKEGTPYEQRLEIGYTQRGIQVWCVRHDCNVIHIDFEGKGPFPANTTRQPLTSSGQGPQT